MKTSINSLHHQTSDWLRELNFYKDELGILRKRLEEVSSKNTSKEVMTQVEHFQNKFIILQEQGDILHHENVKSSEKIDALAKLRPEHIEEKFVNEKESMNARLTDFFSSFHNTRFEFSNFLSKVM